MVSWGVVRVHSTIIGRSRLLADVLADAARRVREGEVGSDVCCGLLFWKISLAAGQLGESLNVTYWSVVGMTCTSAQVSYARPSATRLAPGYLLAQHDKVTHAHG
jgi:hypothetical protein